LRVLEYCERIGASLRTSVARIAPAGCLLLGLAGASAFGADGATITIVNDSTDSVFVTIYDLNTAPPQKVLSRASLYGSASITVVISTDDSGHGHLSWTAMTIDPDMRMCGQKDKPGLNDGDTVRVRADGDCES
jgi:hypothetical protein